MTKYDNLSGNSAAAFSIYNEEYVKVFLQFTVNIEDACFHFIQLSFQRNTLWQPDQNQSHFPPILYQSTARTTSAQYYHKQHCAAHGLHQIHFGLLPEIEAAVLRDHFHAKKTAAGTETLLLVEIPQLHTARRGSAYKDIQLPGQRDTACHTQLLRDEGK